MSNWFPIVFIQLPYKIEPLQSLFDGDISGHDCSANERYKFGKHSSDTLCRIMFCNRFVSDFCSFSEYVFEFFCHNMMICIKQNYLLIISYQKTKRERAI